MADYWKSNPRKFCELCQCWMADNKISVQNHENGMRHKASVAKKMNDLSRGNDKMEKEKQKLQSSLQQINDAAYVSMMKDIERDPSLAKRYGVNIADLPVKSPFAPASDQKDAGNTKTQNNAPTLVWKESITPDGKVYYWNPVTRVSQWSRPDGFIEPNRVPVQKEKDRLQQFVFNKLVELSESGATGANEAVLQTFNVDSNEEDKPTAPKRKTEEADKLLDARDPVQFHGPKIDLLGQWVPVEESPPVKLPKLDLPNMVKPSTDPDLPEQELQILAHLEETAEQTFYSSKHLETTEKTIVPGSLSKSTNQTSVKQDEENSNVPRIVFKRRVNCNNRSLRTATDDM